VIRGEKVVGQTKTRLVADIADEVGIARPLMSSGSSVNSEFLDAIHMAIALTPTGGTDAYRKAEILLDRLGLTYDPYWDTSEGAPTGGGTVTNRAFSRIRSAITDTPRCFILNVTDAPVGTRWERNHAEVYRYDGTVTGRGPLNDAGPGSRIVYYATSKSSSDPKHFIATATVGYIASGWAGPWEARLQDYRSLTHPVSVEELDLPGWNRQHAITEITPATFEALVATGGGEAGGGKLDRGLTDPGAVDVAERVLEDFPTTGQAPAIEVPDQLPATVPSSPPPVRPDYRVEPDDRLAALDPLLAAPRRRDPKRDRLAELRAVELVTKALEGQGWALARDCQGDGVGYDLKFTKGTRLLKVEVKGIQGSRLAFNLTPKEFWCAETDPDWILVAVTSVLSPSAYQLHTVTRDRIVTAPRTVTAYRVVIEE
jgi:hypothetical protein